MANAYETKMATDYQVAAVEEIKTEYKGYLDLLQKAPRLLVGTQVPSLQNPDQNETLRDSEDAREYQEAVKSILADEVRARATKAMEDNADTLNTVHASIELFQNNGDLIPGTKDFDVELANRFAQIAAPYAVKVDEKLIGYSIPVQPIINQLRTALGSERAQAKTQQAPPPADGTAAPAAGVPTSTPGAPAAPAEQPQAGIPSKTGNSSESEDLSSLWGTLGLPNLRL